MTILFETTAPAETFYTKTLVQELTDRGYVFLSASPHTLLLPWHRFVRGARALFLTSFRAKIAMTLPARLLGMRVFWIETRLVDRSLSGHLSVFFYRLFSRHATIVAVSRVLRQQLLDRGVREEQMHVIPPGIPLEHRGVQHSIFGSIAKAKTKRRTGFAIGAVSSLEKEKGVEYLLQAFAMARESIAELHLTILGHGSEKTALQWVAKKLKVEEHVLFVGWQEDLDRWIASFDLVIAPPLRKEGIATFLLTAMAYGKPIIATDVGSLPEIIERRKTGIIIEAGNATMLAEAMVNLYHHPEWREEMGKRARERAEEYFSLPRMINAWDMLLRHEK